jgi:hypothetical protein
VIFPPVIIGFLSGFVLTNKKEGTRKGEEEAEEEEERVGQSE